MSKPDTIKTAIDGFSEIEKSIIEGTLRHLNADELAAQVRREARHDAAIKAIAYRLVFGAPPRDVRLITRSEAEAKRMLREIAAEVKRLETLR